MAARYTGAPAPTRVAYFPFLRNLPILPTGNWRPALDDLVWDFFPSAFPRPPFPPFPAPALAVDIFLVDCLLITNAISEEMEMMRESVVKKQ